MKTFSKNIIFIDTEFSTLDPCKGEILSIGIVKLSGENTWDIYSYVAIFGAITFLLKGFDSNRYFERDLIYPDLTFKDGVMHVPDGDGLGVTIFDDRLEAYCVEKRTL